MNALRTTWTTGLVLLLVAASEASSGDIQALPEDSRVFYVFSHDRAPQRQRVLQLWRQLRAQDAEQRFVAIVRDGQVLAMAEGLTLWSAAMAAQSPEVPAYIKARLDADGDYFAAIDSDDTLRLAGPGQDLLQPLSTEVDESTWGKVKDLFR
jgi:DNA-binding transcriptional regulator YbjK